MEGPTRSTRQGVFHAFHAAAREMRAHLLQGAPANHNFLELTTFKNQETSLNHQQFAVHSPTDVAIKAESNFKPCIALVSLVKSSRNFAGDIALLSRTAILESKSCSSENCWVMFCFLFFSSVVKLDVGSK